MISGGYSNGFIMNLHHRYKGFRDLSCIGLFTCRKQPPLIAGQTYLLQSTLWPLTPQKWGYWTEVGLQNNSVEGIPFV
jgi:hypothetical protein